MQGARAARHLRDDDEGRSLTHRVAGPTSVVGDEVRAFLESVRGNHVSLSVVTATGAARCSGGQPETGLAAVRRIAERRATGSRGSREADAGTPVGTGQLSSAERLKLVQGSGSV